MLVTNTLITQFLGITAILLIIVGYHCTHTHPIWKKSLQIKLSLPLLFLFVTACIVCSIIYTYLEYVAPSDNDHYLALSLHKHGHRLRYICSVPNHIPNLDYSTLKVLINIGSVHSATMSSVPFQKNSHISLTKKKTFTLKYSLKIRVTFC